MGATDAERTTRQPAQQASQHCNEVRIVGRVAASVELRSMPSGDEMTVFRVVVERPAAEVAKARRRSPSVDTLDCVAWRAGVRRSVATWEAGDLVEVTGSLRRRFWRGAHGSASRTEIVVRRGRRLRRAAGA
jgi:single-strand DNA-binding protein